MIPDHVNFHVGWQKAASTTLQYDLFARHSQIANLGKPTKTPEFYRYVLRCPAADYEPAKAQAIWHETVAPKIAEGRALVYSYENLATPPGIDRTAAAQRVAQLFPAGGTILVIRNQFTLLESLFSHLLVTGKIFGTFEQWLRSHLAYPHNTFIAHARFFEIYELYCRLFGRDRVLVLLFEELGADKPAFARQISDFLAIDATETEALLTKTDKRKSRPSRWNALIHQNPALAAVDRAVRPLVPAQARHRMKRLFDHRLQATTDWPPEMRQQLADYFSPGNRQLADLGLPLEDHGYPL